MKKIPWKMKVLVLFFLFGLSLFFYSRFVEPKLIEVNRLTLKFANLPKSVNGVKILQFSDLHLGKDFSLAKLKKVVAKINELKPDLILFTGDLMDEPNKYKEIHLIADILKQAKAPLGKFAVYGNHDHGGYGTENYQKIMSLANFHVLQNCSIQINSHHISRLTIAGIDDLMLGQPDYHKTLNGLRKNDFTILLSHEPDAIEKAAGYKVDFQVSGHSHGGQIRLPFYGSINKPALYTQGLYEKKGTKLYVNRGLGTTRLPFRFFSLPEITLFTLAK
ncbi:metallophosphoesterase [Metabacillus sp. RGM 3146]|uniref:metallophosphoesterase n=1 Tax=Metabacillus sp. RGM 3146 TaxID=3401092 RepID=UPI003B9C017F